MFRNSSQHARTNVVPFVKRPHVVGKLGIAVAKLNMRTALRNDGPANSKERLKYDSGPRAGLIAHADMQPILMD